MKRQKINFRREAFLHPWNLTFLSCAMGAALAIGFTTSNLSWLFNLVLILTAGFELLILGALSNNERFRKVVRARRARAHRKKPSSHEIYAELSREHQRRYLKLRSLKQKIETNYQSFSYASQGILESHLTKIEGLLGSCLSLMQQREQFLHYSRILDEDEVLQDIMNLRKDIRDASDQIRTLKTRRLKVLEQRLQRYKSAQEKLEILNEQIETIEDVVDFIHEQSMTLQNPEQISVQLDVLLTDVAETEATMGEVESIFGDVPVVELDEVDPMDTAEEYTRQRTKRPARYAR